MKKKRQEIKTSSVGVCWFSFSLKSSKNFLLSVVCLVTFCIRGFGRKRVLVP